MESPNFDMNKPLIIFLHGFLESSDGDFSTTVTKATLEQENINVLALDASSILSFIYFRASTCVRFIGKQLAEVLAELFNSIFFQFHTYLFKLLFQILKKKIFRRNGSKKYSHCRT